MALMLRDAGMVKGVLFLLALQLVGINLSGSLVFRLYGVDPEGTRYPRGRSALTWATLAVFAVALVALVAWQLHEEPALERSTLAQRATADVRDVVDASGLARLLEAEAHFTRADIPGQNSLLVRAQVQPAADNTLSDDDLGRRVTDLIQQRLLAGGYGATPFVEVSILHPPRA